METSPAWPWLYELLSEHGIGFVLAHAKKLRAIAEANYKSDEIDAEVLARMRVAGLIPEVHPKSADRREQAMLVRHRTRLVRLRTAAAGRIHAALHSVGLRLPRGRLLRRRDVEDSTSRPGLASASSSSVSSRPTWRSSITCGP